jgi:hypothetical protein
VLNLDWLFSVWFSLIVCSLLLHSSRVRSWHNEKVHHVPHRG